MNNDCLFCRIIDHQLPSNIVYEDELVTVIDDLHPKMRLHKLILPKKHLATFNDVKTDEQDQVLLHMFKVAQKLAAQFRVSESGYQLRLHCNKGGGQEIFHLHLHFLAN